LASLRKLGRWLEEKTRPAKEPNSQSAFLNAAAKLSDKYSPSAKSRLAKKVRKHLPLFLSIDKLSGKISLAEFSYYIDTR